MPPHETPCRPWYRKLHWQIALGILAGLAYAIAVRALSPQPDLTPPDGAAAAELIAHAAEVARARADTLAIWSRAAAPFAFLGDLFIRALKMIIIPLIVASIVTGIQGIGDASALGKVGARTLLYYMGTTLLSVCAGIAVVNIIEPGVGLDLGDYAHGEALAPTPISQVFADIVPTNALAVFAGNDMLPSIFVSVLIGLGLLVIGEEGAPIRRLFESANALILQITDWIMATAPVGVGALFVKTLLDPRLADLASFLADLGSYMAAVLVGLGFHSIVTLPVLLFLLTRRSPWQFARAMTPSLLTAFSTASSSATYPVTLECVTEGAGVSKKSANFVLPLGATINMDGTALYEAVAAIFIANALGFDLGFGQQVVIVITATLAAIGAAGVPSAGLVTMIIVLESVGLPGTAYGLVVAVDRVLDMARTTVNVWGDGVGAAIVGHWIEADQAAGHIPASPPPPEEE